MTKLSHEKLVELNLSNHHCVNYRYNTVLGERPYEEVLGQSGQDSSQIRAEQKVKVQVSSFQKLPYLSG